MSSLRLARRISRAAVAPAVRSAFANRVLSQVARRASSSIPVRTVATAAAAAKDGKAPAMFCYQCEQTQDAKGCTTIGVCGKDSTTSGLQDLIMHAMKGISMWTTRARAVGAQYTDPEINQFVLQTLFSTLTNVNFDKEKMVTYLYQAEKMRDKARNLYVKACADNNQLKVEHLKGTPADFKLPPRGRDADLVAAGLEEGVLAHRAKLGADLAGLQDMIMFGIKGTAAYAEHALTVGQEDESVHARIQSTLSQLCDPNPTVGGMFKLALSVGELNLHVMSLLDKGHTTTFGHPTPYQVPTIPKQGKAILVSGHDLVDIEALLKQVEGTDVNVYTHGEMLPAHGYPGLRKYKNLAGHFGGPWQLQKIDFADFPGAILMTSNCIIEPKKSYKDRIFTRRFVGWPGVKHIDGEEPNFSEVIKAAKSQPGFTAEDVQEASKNKPLLVGFGHNTVLGVADKVLGAIKAGAIKRFFVIGGCDGSEKERSYFRDLARATPKDTVILTLGCGKFRFNSLDMGDIGGIPRVLDVGQCNDAYGAIKIAAALGEALNTPVNQLPISFAVSWFEQKAVAVLLTLLHLNIQNIRLGPNLPAFVTPAVLKVLVDNYKIKPIGEANSDLANMMKGN